ncbi:hypothetical protein H6P81_021409 [Aristolochia fimbriata]|uniref:Uncharacterized protein n=1 Tax=Aristolochia fimbriata TaxID=158543 RepID=A0AAV7DUJ5_ARIFI|nr:hypothetical protein H6P81_021409 [Aristolochia fimbriata]
MACPSTCEQCKGHLPLASVGRWPSALLARGKGPSGPRDPFAQLEFLIFHALCGTVRCPSPDLDLPVRRLWRLCCFAMRGRGIGRADRRRVRVVHVGHAREWCFRPLPMMYSPFETRRPDPCRASAGRAQSGVSVYFPLRLSLRPGVLGNARTPQCSWTHVNAAVRWTWLDSQSESDRPTFAFDRRCPWPGAGLFSHRRVGVGGLSEDATWIGAYHGIGGWRRIRVRFGGSLKAATTSKEGSGAKLPNRRGVKSFVVGPWVGSSVRLAVCTGRLRPFYGDALLALTGGSCLGAVTLKKLECSKQAYALDTLAWDNITGFRSYCVGPGSG